MVPQNTTPDTTPRRIQRKRTRGWKMPEGAIYVGRPTRWGNPWKVGDHGMTAEQAVESYRVWTLSHEDRIDGARGPLAGRDLACWCPLDQPCHADVLLEIANGDL